MADVSTILILGASGDLTSRLLLPALGELLTIEDQRRVRLVGAGTDDRSDEEWQGAVRQAFQSVDASGPAVHELLESTSWVAADATTAEGLQAALDACDGTPAIYFAVPPAVTEKAVEALHGVTLPEGTVLALEKPFGVDARGARRLNALALRLVPEDQVHRIDHFLGRSTVQNLLGLRFANRILEPVWNAEHIERVDLVYDEQLSLEGRASYYDRAGALVDMIQSHLLQVLALFAMEPPSTTDAADLRDAKGLVLRATRVWGDDPGSASRRARYTAGSIADRDIPNYVDEHGVNPANDTETLAALTVQVDTWRWAGVPFTLRSGKALAARRREIVVTFKPAARVPAGLRGDPKPTVLRIFLAPDELSLELTMNGPGDPTVLDRVPLTAKFGAGRLPAYGEVLAGILDSDASLSVRGDTAEQCWRVVEPVLEAWRQNEVPLETYPAGSHGPADWPRP
ncbi:glucose-6-phosphate dehydrogenase [Diaminobutyricimonas sp. TR449]|uniref:glucose-6-phosphate dehydrogenase n=1 Tax=Diaminobutyricimonas sp. TR449 TaxID=2708076 RepID=UPI0014200D54|nr:glucose-6-phosphate dehydrogenase [Diaminobutyricimonas sp. TR449]